MRTYFRLPIKCDCHSPEHFDLVEHCPDCIPVRPATKIKLTMEQAEALERDLDDHTALRVEVERLRKSEVIYLDSRSQWRMRTLTALNEVERYKRWVNDLQSGMYVNCVYCGHRYGPGETTPVSMADALKLHIESCPKHPMSALKAEAERLKALITSIRCIADTEKFVEITDAIDAVYPADNQAALSE
ncbi:MAG: hypothetical protein PHS57_05940 [Alphaproteobacteria bacterium]|nr:hypothetical protein [Alphaproteobacteria bacterium]